MQRHRIHRGYGNTASQATQMGTNGFDTHVVARPRIANNEMSVEQ